MVFDGVKTRIQRFYDQKLGFSQTPPTTFNEALATFDTLLRDAVQKRLKLRRKFGILLRKFIIAKIELQFSFES